MYGKRVYSLLSLNLPSLVILLLGLTATILASYLTRQQEQSIAELEFNQYATDSARSIHDLFTSSLNATTYLSAFLNSVDSISHTNFTAYAEKVIETNNVIQAMEWIPRIEENDLREFERYNSVHIPGFTVTERSTQGELVPVSSRETYYPVQYVVPLDRNRLAVGYDIGSNQERKNMLTKALETNALTASSRVTLVQEQGDSYGILVTRPVFNNTDNTLRGYALGVYRINGIIENSLLKSSFVPSSFKLIDNSSPIQDSQLYKLSPESLSKDDWFYYAEDISIADRHYSIQISEDPKRFLPEYRNSSLILVTGLLLTFMTSAYLVVIRKTNAELKQSNDHLKKLMEEIRTLKGIIPICSYCHSIRDDEGAWEKLELYISRYSEASFSHGICPDCMDRVCNEEGLSTNPD